MSDYLPIQGRETPNETAEIKAPQTEAFLAAKHEELATDYNVHCLDIAQQVAEKLIADNLAPQIEMVYQENHGEDGYTQIEEFLPERYRGTIKPWHSHYVCCTDTHAFDPILGRPVLKTDYTTLAFGKNIELKICLLPDQVRAELKREKSNN